MLNSMRVGAMYASSRWPWVVRRQPVSEGKGLCPDVGLISALGLPEWVCGALALRV